MSALPQLKPMLLDERPFDLNAPGWAYEIKFDGYRLLAEFGQGRCLLKTRNGANATTWFPEITRPLSNIKLFPEGPYVVDGEVCVLDDHGRSDFDRLHDRARRRSWYAGCDPVTYCVFDILQANGVDLTQGAYLDRKERLQRLLTPPPPGILYVGHFESDGEKIFQGAVLPLKLEGLVAKRIDSAYQPGVRASDWVKVKRKGAIPPERFKRNKAKEIP
jgi:bifunctional non-homologous end joining protein LigD